MLEYKRERELVLERVHFPLPVPPVQFLRGARRGSLRVPLVIQKTRKKPDELELELELELGREPVDRGQEPEPERVLEQGPELAPGQEPESGQEPAGSLE